MSDIAASVYAALDALGIAQVIGDDRLSFGSPERLMRGWGSRRDRCRRSG